MIEIRNITKRFGQQVAVDDLSFDVHPGRVTGFLGPNGSGKSTTMRCMLGLDRPERGTTTFDGKRYSELRQPLFEVGALLDAGYVHPGRSGRNHLRWLAASNGIGAARVDEVLELVGLTSVARRKVKGYSLGMRQRLGLAGVLLGDPHTVILDEPANGLDPEGMRWIRDVLVAPRPRGPHGPRQQPPAVGDRADGRRPRRDRPRPADRAGPGRAVHRPLRRSAGCACARRTRPRSPSVLRRAGAQFRPHGQDGIDVHGLPIERVGELAAADADRAARAVAAERVAGGRLPAGDRRRPGVPLGVSRRRHRRRSPPATAASGSRSGR